MTKCDFCGRDIEKIKRKLGYDLPFNCKYCGGNFCSDHRLPENHNCSKLPEGWDERVRFQDEKYRSPKIPFKLAEREGMDLEEKIKDLDMHARMHLYTSKLKQLTHFFPKKISVRTIFNLAFLLVISLPVLDSVQLMWDSPLTFSRTFLPKWWNLFPSEYPIPSINLLYLYFGMLGLFILTIWKFISKSGYGRYATGRLKIKHYYYVIIVGATFLYFFSEANFFWLYSIQKLISNFRGGL